MKRLMTYGSVIVVTMSVAAALSCRTMTSSQLQDTDNPGPSVDPAPAVTPERDNRSSAGGLRGSRDNVLESAPAFQISPTYPETTEFQTDPPPTPDMDKIKAGDQVAARDWLLAMQAYIYQDMNDQSADDPNRNFRLEPGADRVSSKRWYHMPWLHSAKWTETKPGRGRDATWGLTRELDLEDEAGNCLGQDWGIGFFNEPAGYAIGKMFPAGETVDLNSMRNAQGSVFPRGSVSFKILFTTAQAERFNGAYEINANINGGGACLTPGVAETRTPTTLRHIQMDIMMKIGDGVDDWLFGVFVYNPNKRDQFWQGMEPLGVQWSPKEDGTLVVSDELRPNGLHGRLNGPADNPLSSCLSCHARAQWPELPSRRLPFAPKTVDDIKAICLLHDWGGEGNGDCPACPANGSGCIPANTAPVAPTGLGLDYSLQLALALRNRAITLGE